MYGVEVPVYHFGEIFGTRRVYNDSLLMFLLRNRAPKRFSADSWAKAAAATKGRMDRLKKQWRKEWEEEKKKKDHYDSEKVLEDLNRRIERRRQSCGSPRRAPKPARSNSPSKPRKRSTRNAARQSTPRSTRRTRPRPRSSKPRRHRTTTPRRNPTPAPRSARCRTQAGTTSPTAIVPERVSPAQRTPPMTIRIIPATLHADVDLPPDVYRLVVAAAQVTTS